MRVTATGLLAHYLARLPVYPALDAVLWGDGESELRFNCSRRQCASQALVSNTSAWVVSGGAFVMLLLLIWKYGMPDCVWCSFTFTRIAAVNQFHVSLVLLVTLWYCSRLSRRESQVNKH